MKKNILFIIIILIILIINIDFSNNSNTDKVIVRATNYLCNFYSKNNEIESPIIILNGSNDIYLDKGSDYLELGAKAIDNCSGDISNKIKTEGFVNTNKEGIYKVKYKIIDDNNNTNIVERNVYVREKHDEKGVIYLTFDDGPSKSITPYILDILNKENIKATFFVINHPNNTDYLLKRIKEGGHSIGLHSYSHDYSYIYSSIDNYFNDLSLIKEKVYNLTGVNSNIIRFPGGTSNLVSKKYFQGIMSSLVEEVSKYEYIYYDWNVESNDSGGVNSSEEVYNNVISNLSLDKVNMVLLHDYENNYYTLEALPKIIKYAKDNGYIFKSISNDTVQIKHIPNN